jgi:hypothetical protein
LDGNSTNAYRMLVGRHEGKQPIERLRRWKDNMKMDLREVASDGRRWAGLA